MADQQIMDAYERSVCQECGQLRNAEAQVERLREAWSQQAIWLADARAEAERLREERDRLLDDVIEALRKEYDRDEDGPGDWLDAIDFINRLRVASGEQA